MTVTNCVNDTPDFFKVNVLADTLRECFSNTQFAETMEQNINYAKNGNILEVSYNSFQIHESNHREQVSTNCYHSF